MADGWSIAVDLGPLEAAITRATNPDLTPLTAAIRGAAEYVRQTWASAVQGDMLPGMTRAVRDDKYHESLATGESLRMITALHGVVISTYDGVDRIEQGYAAYDMKPAILAGPNARESKDGGKYNTVPFRHMTPKGNDPIGTPRPHGATMPTGVYNIVKQAGQFKDPGNAALGQQIGQRSKLPAAINLEAQLRNQRLPMAGAYTWKYGMYHGMRQVQHAYGKKLQSTYWTYRRVSTKSDPDSWIHPGAPANPVIDAVVNATRATVEQMILDGAAAAFGA